MAKIGYFNAVLSDQGTPILATVTANLAGTETLAVIYVDAAGSTLKDNPFQTDALGRFQFFAAAGLYDLIVSGSGVLSFTISSVSLTDITKSTELTDMPDYSPSGNEGKMLQVNSARDGYDLVEPPSGGAETTLDLSDMPDYTPEGSEGRALVVKATRDGYELGEVGGVSAHASSHQAGGDDPIKLDDLSAPDDNTDLNASAANHGLLPKLPNAALQRLNGVGAWTELQEDEISFYDEFIGAALAWPWRTSGVTAYKTITVSGGKASMAIAEGTDARWDSAELNQLIFYTACLGGFNEYILRFSNASLGKNTALTITISYNITQAIPGNRAVQITFSYDGTNKSFSASNPNVVGSKNHNEDVTAGYLKIRMVGGYLLNYFEFFYSLDGSTWTQIEVSGGGSAFTVSNLNESNRQFHVGVGLYNWSDGGSYHGISADIEWFKVTRPRGVRA